MLPLAKGLLGSMTPKALFRFAKIMAKGEPGLDKRFDREKKPYLFVGLVCVREPYQGQGYMRRIMDMAFREGDRLGVPVLLETDAKSKCGQVRPPRHAACRNAPLRRARRAVRPDPLSGGKRRLTGVLHSNKTAPLRGGEGQFYLLFIRSARTG